MTKCVANNGIKLQVDENFEDVPPCHRRLQAGLDQGKGRTLPSHTWRFILCIHTLKNVVHIESGACNFNFINLVLSWKNAGNLRCSYQIPRYCGKKLINSSIHHR